MIIYNRNTGNIVAQIPDDQDMMTFFYHYPQEFKDSLDSLDLKNIPYELENHIVVNGELVEKPSEELYSKIKSFTSTQDQQEIENLKKQVAELSRVLGLT